MVHATASWDPDGAGPLAPRIVVAGDFQLAGDQPASRIAAYDPATGTWSAFGSGMDADVRALTVLPNGELVAGGYFSLAGGVSANRVARWTGSSWAPLGSGIFGLVSALASHPNGDLFVGGQFTMAGGQQASHIARWDGSNWSPVGLGMDWEVLALDVMSNGDVVAGGEFAAAGTVLADGLARWDGSRWSEIGSGLGSLNNVIAVEDVHALPNGGLLVAGIFDSAGGTSAVGLARWDGASWSGLGLATFSQLAAVTQLPGGDVVVAGAVRLPGQIDSVTLARRSSSGTWSSLLPNLSSNVQNLLVLAGGELIAAGNYSSIGGAVASSVALWDTFAWQPLPAGGSSGNSNGQVLASKVLANGDLVVGGLFSLVGGVAADSVARWNGQSWAPLGVGVAGLVRAIEELPNGDIVVAGFFQQAGGLVSEGIARWDGTSWISMSGLGAALAQEPIVSALAVLPNGDLVVGGNFTTVSGVPAPGLATWNGSGWTPFPGLVPAFGNWILDVLVLANGDLLVGGGFQVFGGSTLQGIARWDGASWDSLGGGIGLDVHALAELANGDLVAGGRFAQAGGTAVSNIARWDGSTWSGIGAGFDRWVFAIQVLPGGDMIVGGQLGASGGVATAGIARWDGGSWGPVEGGVSDSVLTLALDAQGDLVVGGRFTVVGDPSSATGEMASAYLARLRPPCPATVVATGSGCVGSSGLVELSATTSPWLGGTFTSVATGMPSNSLAIEVRGLGTASIPLSNVLAQAAPGCTLQVTPDLLGIIVPGQGTATSSFALPNVTALVGAVLHQQLAALEFDAAGSIVEATTSNALTLTIGVF